MTGITGVGAPVVDLVGQAVARLRRHTVLPIAVGFGIRTAQQAAEVAKVADAAVVGSALVDCIARSLDEQSRAGPGLVRALHEQVEALALGVRGARR
jgi:tryptophan synthase alpha chain